MTFSQDIPAAVGEGLKQGAGQRIVVGIPFRVPLHPHGKAFRRRDRNRLDKAIGGVGLGRQAVAQAVNPLVVKRIYTGLGEAGDPGQNAAGDDRDGMGRAIADGHGLVLIVGVIDLVRKLENPLMQAATKGDVEFLMAPADAQNRQSGINGITDQRQGRGITVCIVEGAGGAVRAVIMMGFDVGAAAGKYHAVDPPEQGLSVQGIAQGRHHQGNPPANAFNGPHIHMPGRIHFMLLYQHSASGNADNRFCFIVAHYIQRYHKHLLGFNGSATMNFRALYLRNPSPRMVIALLLVSVAGMGAAIGITFPLISLTLERLEFGSTLIGINTATGSLGIIIVGLFTGRLLRSFGNFMPLLAATALSVGSLLIMPLIDHAAGWFVLRFTLALGLGFLWLLSESWINGLASNERRGRMIGYYSAAFSSGFAVGPLLVATIGSIGSFPFVVTAAIITVSAIPLILLSNRESVTKIGGSAQMSLFWIAPVIFLVALAAGLFETTAYSLLPIFTLRTGLSEMESLYALSACSAGGIALQMPLGRLADTKGRDFLMAVTAIGILLGIVAMPYAVYSTPLLLALLFFWGGMIFGMYTLGLILLGDKYPTSDLIAANAVFIIFYEVGGFGGPALSGLAMDLWPDHGFTSFLLMVAIIFAGLTIFHLRRNPDKVRP